MKTGVQCGLKKVYFFHIKNKLSNSGNSMPENISSEITFDNIVHNITDPLGTSKLVEKYYN